ncbi:MAG: acyl-CoA dehydrogenase family protein [Pseudomonadales bacterium]
MQFTFTDEQEQFRAVVRRFLAQKSPATEVRRLMATAEGFDDRVWRQLADELALTGLHLPEEYGGAGFGAVELGIAMEEQGRALLCAPYFSSCVLAAGAILEAGSEEQKSALLPDIASGQVRAALALTEPNGRWDAAGVEAVATESDGVWKIDGIKSFVIDGCTADSLVVAARTDAAAVSFFLVDPQAPGLTRTPLATMDATRKQARIELHGVAAELLGERGAATRALPRVLDHAAIALANEMVGGAQALLESAVAYANLRVQFGRAIGSFQAIKHKCADMLLEVELAKSAAYAAAQAEAAGDPETPMLASMAKAAAADAYRRAAADTIQIHGGIGFTWENDTHLWFKRAKSSEVLFGDGNHHRELMLQRMEG